MRKEQHINLFLHGNKQEVYAALQRDYDRDTWRHAFWHVVFVCSAVGAASYANHNDWLWLFAGMYALERALSRFIDNSNRNWTLHLIDWLEHTRGHDAEHSVPSVWREARR